jgi:hypothetical protein
MTESQRAGVLIDQDRRHGGAASPDSVTFHDTRSSHREAKLSSAGVVLTLGLVLGLAAAGVPTLGPAGNARPPHQLEPITPRVRAWMHSKVLSAAGASIAEVLPMRVAQTWMFT